MHLHFTSGYHLEGDGQTECTNQTLEQYIRVYCNYQQDNWDSLLPLAEFAYNNAPSTTTGISPFFANKGYHPNITVHPERDFVSIRAREFAVELDKLHSALKDHIQEAQSRYQVSANCTHSLHPEFPIGSSTFVKAQQPDPLRSLLRSISVRLKSLAEQVCTLSYCVCLTLCGQSIRSFMFPCWNRASRIPFRTESNPPLHPSLLMASPNTRYPKFSTPKLTAIDNHATYSTLSAGPATRVPTTRHLGCWLPS